jgi:hypothetical protein
VYTDRVDFLGEDMNNIKKNTETALDSSENVYVKVKIKKIYRPICTRLHHNSGQTRKLMRANIWEQQQETYIAFLKKFRAEWIRRMSTKIQFRTFGLSLFCLKT